MRKIQLLILFQLWALVCLAEAPVIESFSPVKGEVGMIVTITGANFSSKPEDNIIYFGGVRGNEILTATATQLTVKVPYCASYAPISVTVNKLTAASALSFIPTFRSDYSLDSSSFSRVPYGLGGGPVSSLALGDMDNDGKPDLVGVIEYTGTLQIYHNQSNRGQQLDENTFKRVNFFHANTTVSHINIADMDGDGRLDIIAVVNHKIMVFQNQSSAEHLDEDSFIPVEVELTQESFSVDGLKVADLDGDGKPDLIMNIYDDVSGFILIYKNIHEGSIITSNSFEENAILNISYQGYGFSLADIAVGDLNGDNKPEVISSGSSSDEDRAGPVYRYFSIFLNLSGDSLPDISFSSEISSSIEITNGIPLYNLSIVDVDADSNNDIAFISTNEFNNPVVGILRNKGLKADIIHMADFDERLDIEFIDLGLTSLLFRDLNGDSRPELIVGNTRINSSVIVLENSSVQSEINFFDKEMVFFNNGTTRTDLILAGDLDLDGRPDLVATPRNYSICLLHNRIPLPIPQVKSFSPLSADVHSVITITGGNFSQDIDGNKVYFGAAKAVITDASSTSLTAIVPPGVTYNPVSVTVNGLTGYSDIPFSVTVSSAQAVNDSSLDSTAFTKSLEFLLSPVDNVKYPSENDGIALGDFDLDGKVDIAITDTDFITVLTNTSTYTAGRIPQLSLAEGITYPLTEPADPANLADLRPKSIVTQDINGDGLLDIIIGSDQASQLITVLANTGLSDRQYMFNRFQLFEKDTNRATFNLYSTKVGDFSTDGKPDYLVLYNTESHEGSLSLLLNNNNPNLPQSSYMRNVFLPVDYSPIVPSSIAAGDFDGDGKADIVFSSKYGNSIYILNNKSISEEPSFTSIAIQVSADGKYDATGPYILETGDIDGDGKLDIILLNIQRKRVSVLRNTGAIAGNITEATFSQRQSFILPDSPSGMKLGDVDGDGKLDIILISQDNKKITVLRNTGMVGVVTPNTFRQNQILSIQTQGFPYSIALGDRNGDRKPEILIKEHSTERNMLVLSIYENTIKPLPPTIESFTPEGAGPGDSISVILTGTHFTDVQSVSIGGVNQPEFVVNSQTQLEMKVPPGVLSGPIKIITNGGEAISPEDFIAISAAEAISGNITICQQATDVEYYVAPIAGAQAYQWTLPKGAHIISGNYTNSIVVYFDSTASSGELSVKGMAGSFQGKASPGFALRVDSTPAAPLNLLATVSPENSAIHLSWKAYPADNTANFFIERAENSSENFLQISIRPPNENSYIDNTVTAGTTYYYRMRARLNPCFSSYSTTSGAATAANVFTTGVGSLAAKDKIKLFPNPTADILQLEIKDLGVAKVTVKATDLLGVIHKAMNIAVHPNQHVYSWDIHELVPGIYLITIEAKNEKFIQKIIKQ